MLILLYLFNPIVTSLRGIQQASELANVQKKLGCPRASLGSLAEASTVFDAERLKEIIAELGAELTPLVKDARLQDIQQTMTLVDGTLIEALPPIMEASPNCKDTTANPTGLPLLAVRRSLLRGRRLARRAPVALRCARLPALSRTSPPPLPCPRPVTGQ